MEERDEQAMEEQRDAERAAARDEHNQRTAGEQQPLPAEPVSAEPMSEPTSEEPVSESTEDGNGGVLDSEAEEASEPATESTSEEPAAEPAPEPDGGTTE